MSDDDNLIECTFLTGSAGSGKTFEIKRRIEEDPHYGLLASTTGISAINLGTTTIHSKLGFYDIGSLRDSYTSGRLHRRLKALYDNGLKRLVIDEISMLHAEQLDLIHITLRECAMGANGSSPFNLGLALTGDFCQLPPVNGRWAFQADCWPHFVAGTTRLRKIWRQADPGFLEGLNLARSGDGPAAAQRFKELGAQYSLGLDLNFDGTTIVAKNAEVDRYNNIRLMSIKEQAFTLYNSRWGVQSSDWKIIPPFLALKPTALVMLLSNTRGEGGEFLWANGDLAHIGGLNHATAAEDSGLSLPPSVSVRLMRNDTEHYVPMIVRQNTSKHEPSERTIQEASAQEGDREPFYDSARKRWVLGEVCYWPLRLAYASTCHKSQGLSLDRVQIDCRDGFFGSYNLAYVALSRARTIEGLRIVGGPGTLAGRINLDPEVADWL